MPRPAVPMQSRHRLALGVALAYGLVGALWILGSDGLLSLLVTDPGRLTMLSALKGWLFVGVTAALLYLLLRRWTGAEPDTATATHRAGTDEGEAAGSIWRWPLLWRLTAVVAVTVAVLAYDHGEKMRHQRAQIEAVADLRSTEVQSWLAAHLAPAEFVRGSRRWADLYRRWFELRDTAALDQLMARATDLRLAFGHHSVWLLDGQAAVVASDAASPGPVSAALRRAALTSLATGTVQHTGPHEADDRSGPVWLDVVIPLGTAGGTAQAVVVLRVDAAASLLRQLDRWPVPTRTATTLLVRREGDLLVGVRGRLPLPLSTSDNLAARAIRSPSARPSRPPMCGARRCWARCARYRRPTGTWWRASIGPKRWSRC